MLNTSDEQNGKQIFLCAQTTYICSAWNQENEKTVKLIFFFRNLILDTYTYNDKPTTEMPCIERYKYTYICIDNNNLMNDTKFHTNSERSQRPKGKQNKWMKKNEIATVSMAAPQILKAPFVFVAFLSFYFCNILVECLACRAHVQFNHKIINWSSRMQSTTLRPTQVVDVHLDKRKRCLLWQFDDGALHTPWLFRSFRYLEMHRAWRDTLFYPCGGRCGAVEQRRCRQFSEISNFLPSALRQSIHMSTCIYCLLYWWTDISRSPSARGHPNSFWLIVIAFAHSKNDWSKPDRTKRMGIW